MNSTTAYIDLDQYIGLFLYGEEYKKDLYNVLVLTPAWDKQENTGRFWDVSFKHVNFATRWNFCPSCVCDLLVENFGVVEQVRFLIHHLYTAIIIVITTCHRPMLIGLPGTGWLLDWGLCAPGYFVNVVCPLILPWQDINNSLKEIQKHVSFESFETINNLCAFIHLENLACSLQSWFLLPS